MASHLAERTPPPSVADSSLNNTTTLKSLLKSHVVGISVGIWIANLSSDVIASAIRLRANCVCQNYLEGDFHAKKATCTLGVFF
jgi:hypothetical protein